MKRTKGPEVFIQTLPTEKFYHFLKAMLSIKSSLRDMEPYNLVSELQIKAACDQNASSL